MNVTIFPTGTGSTQSAVDYLLSDNDHEGKPRSVLPEIVYGDPQSLVAIADNTSRKHKYTSGVISFRDSEHLSNDQVTALIQSFRAVFLPGLKVDENFADLWVAHRDKGNLELHFLVANTELKTGSRLNIHPPGEVNLQFFNTFVSVCNDTFGFAQVVPDPLKIALSDFEAKSPNGKKDKKAKQSLASILHKEILNGHIKDRGELIAYISENLVEVPRVGKDYITVKMPGAKKGTRLRGELFKEDSDYQKLIKQHYESKKPKYLTPLESHNQREKLNGFIQFRRGFNHQAYLFKKEKKSYQRTKKTGAPIQKPSNLGSRIADRVKQIRSVAQAKDIAAAQPLPIFGKDIKMKPEAARSPLLVHQNIARFRGILTTKDESPRDETSTAGLVGLEAQIGMLCLNLSTLRIALARATPKQFIRIQAQILLIESRLTFLNLELEEKQKKQKKKLT